METPIKCHGLVGVVGGGDLQEGKFTQSHDDAVKLKHNLYFAVKIK